MASEAPARLKEPAVLHRYLICGRDTMKVSVAAVLTLAALTSCSTKPAGQAASSHALATSPPVTSEFVSTASSPSVSHTSTPPVTSDRKDLSDLGDATAAAKTFFTINGTYRGFDAATASTISPRLRWANGTAARNGIVNITGVSDTTVVVETKGSSGTSFCAADDVHRGTVLGYDTKGRPFGNYMSCRAAQRG